MGEETQVVNTLAGEAITKLPRVSESAITKASGEETPTDTQGVAFDETLHQGLDKRTKSGAFLKKRAPRKKREAASTVGATDQQISHECVLAGATAASTLFLTMQTFFGDEWTPVEDKNTGINERQVMSHAFATYFEAKGIQDLPPGIILVTTLAFYAAPRFQQPHTSQKLAGTWYWLKSKFSRKRRVRSESHVDTGQDGMRQNNTRQEPR